MVSTGIYVSGFQPSGQACVSANPTGLFHLQRAKAASPGTPFALGWYIVGPSALRDVAGGELFPFVA